MGPFAWTLRVIRTCSILQHINSTYPHSETWKWCTIVRNAWKQEPHWLARGCGQNEGTCPSWEKEAGRHREIPAQTIVKMKHGQIAWSEETWKRLLFGHYTWLRWNVSRYEHFYFWTKNHLSNCKKKIRSNSAGRSCCSVQNGEPFSIYI